MLTTPTISSTPLHQSRLHARPPGGIEPQAAVEATRSAREGDRLRQQAVAPAEKAAGAQPGRTAAQSVALASPGRGGDGLSPEERAILAELAARDREVRTHEAAHARVGGRFAGSPRYDFVTGPDGARYAVSGQVVIDVSPVRADPAATIAKMRVVRAAALAPAEPSPADRRVAQLAEQLMRAAEADLRRRQAFEKALADGVETARLSRLSALFARTALLPAPEPSVMTAA
ncbi:MAG: putative metalloprotease CJM1_0395 family protein [Pikeienuella sp.]